jgi:hypothetical protein
MGCLKGSVQENGTGHMLINPSFFETGSHHVAQAGLELKILLP